MHELSIAQSIIDTVSAELQSRNLTRVQVIGVKIGVLSGILPDALEFGFDALIRDTPLAGAKLAIEHIPVSGTCQACGREFVLDELDFACPACGSTDLKMTAGDELRIAYLEVEDAES